MLCLRLCAGHHRVRCSARLLHWRCRLGRLLLVRHLIEMRIRLTLALGLVLRLVLRLPLLLVLLLTITSLRTSSIRAATRPLLRSVIAQHLRIIGNHLWPLIDKVLSTLRGQIHLRH